MKDDTGKSAISRSRVALLHIIATSRLIEILKDDPRAIFTAASKAQAAADWMHAQQSRQMLTSDRVDIDTIPAPLAQPD